MDLKMPYFLIWSPFINLSFLCHLRKRTIDQTRIYSIPHDAPDASCIVTKRQSMASLIQDIYIRTIVGNKVIIKACIMDSEMPYFLISPLFINLPCLCHPYNTSFLITFYEIFHLLVSFHLFTTFSSDSFRM